MIYDFNNNQLQELILDSIKQKKALALCRFNDGEYICTQPNHWYYKQLFLGQLGYFPSEQHRTEIVNNLLDSINGCDVVGITSNEGDTWKETREFFLSKLNKNQKTCSVDFHHEFLLENKYDEIFKVSKKLLIISGYDLSEQFKLKYPNLEEIKTLQITNAQWMRIGIKVIHYPDIYNNVINEINKMDLTGYLCIIGAGFVGKKYINYCKKQGAVALDVGSTFDRWAGYGTRGPQGLKLSIDATYKI